MRNYSTVIKIYKNHGHGDTENIKNTKRKDTKAQKNRNQTLRHEDAKK